MKGVRASHLVAGIIGSAALVAGVLGVANYERDLRFARERIDSLGSQVIDTACGRIEYAVSGTGYPVLVVHGNAGGFDQGLGLARGYLGEGFQVIAPSRYGYLRTPLPEGASPASQADAFACLLDALGIRQVAVMGTSAGATSSIQFALRHPDRVSALVLHSPNALGEVGLVPPPRPVFRAMIGSDFAFWTLSTYFTSGMQAVLGVPKELPLTPEYRAEIRAVFSEVLPTSLRADGMMFDTFISNPDINSGYPFGEIKVPVLVASAVDDPMALHEGARALADRITGARLLAVPDGGHMMLGHVEEVRAEIVRFVRESTAMASSAR